MAVVSWTVNEKPTKRNVLNNLDLYNWGARREANARLSNVRNSLVARNLSTFDILGQVWKFPKRITSISWHPKSPYLATAADKAGNLIQVRGCYDEKHELQFKPSKLLDGTGADGAIFSLKYLDDHPEILFTAALDGTVRRMNMLNPKKSTQVFHDFKDYTQWFTSMDVSQFDRTVIAGDNKGYARIFDVDGLEVATIQLHKRKIHYCEFNRRVPWLVSTASLHTDHEVCLWDIRKLSNEPICVLPHNKGANVACFNPLNGSRLLTTDQKDEIRVYEGPLWHQSLSIQHPHRQFQHITGIRADWHPLTDAIVLGRYPAERKMDKKDPTPLRPIEFFDADTGDLISQLHHPLNGIVSLNKFSNTGEILASGMGCNLIFWESTSHLEQLYGGGTGRKNKANRIITDALRETLRGTVAGNDDEPEDIDNLKKRKKSTTKTATNKKAKLTLETKEESKKTVGAKKVVKRK